MYAVWGRPLTGCRSSGVLSTLVPKEGIMKSHNKKDVFVVQHPDGWAVKKPHAGRASAVLPTKQEAVKRAKEIAGHGSIRVQGTDAKFKHK